MKAHRFPSLVEWSLPLLVALAETAAMAPLVLVIAGFFDQQQTMPTPWIPALGLTGFAAFGVTRKMTAAEWSIRRARLLAVVGWIITTLLWIAGERWHGSTGAAAPVRFGLLAALSLLAWWRGIGYGVDPAPFLPDRLSRIVQQCWMLLVAGLLLIAMTSGFDTDAAYQSAEWAIPITAVSGLLLLAIGQIEESGGAARSRGGRGASRRGWIGFALLFALGLLLIASAGSALLGGERGNLLLDGLGFVLGLVLWVGSWFALGLALLFYLLLYPLFWLLRRGAGNSQESRSATQLGETSLTDIVQSNGDALPDWVRVTLMVIAGGILAIIVILVLVRAMQRFRPVQPVEAGVEERESLWSSELARAQLRDLFRRRREEKRDDRIDLDAIPPTVRDAYRALQTLAAEQGYPRLPNETASEFSLRLTRVWPGEAREIAELTRSYEQVRYAGAPETTDRERVQGFWHAIRERRREPHT